MKKFLFVCCFLAYISCQSQKSSASINASGDLVGVAVKSDFQKGAYKNWFQAIESNYTPNKQVISQLKKKWKHVTIKAFMGTWCGDSKRETPRFYKVLEAANFNLKKLEMITVNRSKRTPNNLQAGHNIIRVPTFIFYKKGKEIGRYVEYPRETLEKDILKIVSKQPYKHSYDHSK